MVVNLYFFTDADVKISRGPQPCPGFRWSCGQVPALHQHLYENRDAHPGSGTEPVHVHYILACRVIMGYFAMTQESVFSFSCCNFP